MALSNGASSSTQELVNAQAQLWNQIHNYINSMTLKCAIQLGISEAIHKHGKPMTLSELADALPINKFKSNGLYRLMRILVHSKFFEKFTISKNDGVNEEAYSLTPASRLVLRDEPMSIMPFALAALDPVIMDPFQYLNEWFRNEHPTPFFTKNGRSPWEYAEADPRWNQVYNEAMASDARFVASVLVKECKHVFEGLKTMVDVGGGTGMVAKAVTDAFSGLRCIVLDLPHVVEGLEGTENLTYVGGNMLEYVPHADAVFLKWILCMWCDEDGVRILKKCKEAVNSSKGNGGKVIIVEIVVGDDKEDHEATETQYLLDMHMMARFAAGRERSEKEWAHLFLAAGFTTYKITPVLGLRSVIEVFP